MNSTSSMISDLKLLIDLLHYINNDKLIHVNNNQYDRNHPIVSAALYLSNEILISDDGHPDRENIDEVISNGFHIYPGEMDRYGWLTGCIELSRGIILFG
jgi:hypothetical protein